MVAGGKHAKRFAAGSPGKSSTKTPLDLRSNEVRFTSFNEPPSETRFDEPSFALLTRTLLTSFGGFVGLFATLAEGVLAFPWERRQADEVEFESA